MCTNLTMEFYQYVSNMSNEKCNKIVTGLTITSYYILSIISCDAWYYSIPYTFRRIVLYVTLYCSMSYTVLCLILSDVLYCVAHSISPCPMHIPGNYRQTPTNPTFFTLFVQFDWLDMRMCVTGWTGWTGWTGHAMDCTVVVHCITSWTGVCACVGLVGWVGGIDWLDWLDWTCYAMMRSCVWCW